MMSPSHRVYRRRNAVALAAWLVLPSAPVLTMAACAASDETAEPNADASAVVPSNDSGNEASTDAATEVDASALPCAAGDLCSAPTPLALGFITAIRGRAKNDVWASGTGGLVMHWDGQVWTALESKFTETLTSIFLTADEMWGIGGELVVRRGLDPASAFHERVTDWDYYRSMSSIAVLSNGDAYVSLASNKTVGWRPGEPTYDPNPVAKLDFGSLAFRHASDPAHPDTGQTQYLVIRAGVLVPDKALWFVGERAAVARYPIAMGDGGVPSVGQGVTVPVSSSADLLAVWAHDEQIWAVGRGGTILHFDGAEWQIDDAGTTATLNAVFGLSPNDIWAVGDDGTALHFDGKTWSPVGVGGYRGSLRAIWASGHDDVWIGGEDGMFHWGALP